jgi:hypothetical protein
MEVKTILDFQKEWSNLVDKGYSNYLLLTPDERMWFNIQSLLTFVDNGGLISYYYNSGADHNRETIADLIALGFLDIASLLQQIDKLFPNGKMPLVVEERNTAILEWGGKYDDLLCQFEDFFLARELDLEKALINHIQTKIII